MDKHISLVLGAVLLLVHYLSAEKVININSAVDKQLNILNKKITEAGEGLLRIPDIALPRVRFSKGVQYGVNSMNRTADCTATIFNNGSVYADYHIGYRLLVFAFGKIAVQNGDMMSGASRIHKNSAHISYTLKRSPHSCNVSLGWYRFEAMTDADFQASIPKYDGQDASHFFSKVFLPYVNQQMRKERAWVEKQIKEYVCPKDDSQIELEDILAKPLKTFLGYNVFTKLQGPIEIDMDTLFLENLLLSESTAQ